MAMEATFTHQIIFSNEDQISVSDVANSLLANERLVLSIGGILEGCIHGLVVEKICVDFRSATINSPLTEELVPKIIFTFQEALTREVPLAIEALSGVQIDEKYRGIVTTLVLILVVYGIDKARKFFRKDDNAEEQKYRTQIINNYGTLLQAGRDLTGADPHQIDAAIQRTFKDRQAIELAKTALRFIQPAKRTKGGAIRGAGLTIEPETIEAAPSLLEIQSLDTNENQTPYEKREVVIHATDKDHGASGWAGHIVGVWEKRLRMKLFPAISPSSLFGRDKIVADVVLVSKRQPDGSFLPYLFHVIDVYE